MAKFSSSPDAAQPASLATDSKQAADDRAAAFGRIVAMLMSSQRHSKLTLSQVNDFLTPAIAHGQFAVIGAQKAENGPVSLAAAAWWAMVTPEVDQRLTESRDEFLTLEKSEWAGGDQPWIVEAIGEPRIVNELVKRVAARNFKDRPAKVRAILPDGRIAVGKLEPRPAAPEQTKN